MSTRDDDDETNASYSLVPWRGTRRHVYFVRALERKLKATIRKWVEAAAVRDGSPTDEWPR